MEMDIKNERVELENIKLEEEERMKYVDFFLNLHM